MAMPRRARQRSADQSRTANGRLEPEKAGEDTAGPALGEKTQLEAADLTLLSVFSGPAARQTYPDGNVVDWVTVVYMADGPEDTPQSANPVPDPDTLWTALERCHG